MPARGVRATITGRVQGVGYRWATRRVAVELGVVGWVRNRPDGSVEVLAQGSTETTTDLLRFLQHGPPGAVVATVDVEEIEPEPGLEGFEITT